jgi:hypothetical protein
MALLRSHLCFPGSSHFSLAHRPRSQESRGKRRTEKQSLARAGWPRIATDGQDVPSRACVFVLHRGSTSIAPPHHPLLCCALAVTSQNLTWTNEGRQHPLSEHCILRPLFLPPCNAFSPHFITSSLIQLLCRDCTREPGSRERKTKKILTQLWQAQELFGRRHPYLGPSVLETRGPSPASPASPLSTPIQSAVNHRRREHPSPPAASNRCCWREQRRSTQIERLLHSPSSPSEPPFFFSSTLR